jgi:hypothetical protein
MKFLSLEEIDLIFTGESERISEVAAKIHEGALADEKDKMAAHSSESEMAA